ncbi:MAG TPA: hypothetical protein VGX00_07150 [Thermoplasmata archaeon]|nr:hypothetical protein [Thermoplasmata archaeon]
MTLRIGRTLPLRPGVGLALLLLLVVLMILPLPSSAGPRAAIAPSPGTHPAGALGHFAPTAIAAAPAPAQAPIAPGSPPPAPPSIGTLFATVNVDVGGTGSAQPLGGVYDPTNGFVYVADSGSNSVAILNGTSLVTSVVVPARPEGGAYDPIARTVDIVSEGANSVTFLNGTNIVGTIAVGSKPYGAAFDPATGEVNVVNYGSDNVTLIRGSRTVGAIALPPGSGPVAAAYDPSDSEVYVSEYATDSVSILSATAVVKTVRVGLGPGEIAYDAANQEVYVTGSLSGNFTTLSGTSVIGNTPLGYSAWGVSYDPENQLIYLTDNGTDNVTAVSGTQILGVLPTDSYPLGDVFDATNGCVYVMNRDSGNVLLISTSLRMGPAFAFPSGSPANTTDLGETVSLNATVQGNQSWAYQTSIQVTPNGLGCAVDPTLSINAGFVFDYCTPVDAGTYLATLVVNATGRITVTSTMTFVVYPKFSLGLPTAAVGARTNVGGADLGYTVNWNLSPIGGTQRFSAVNWTGFPAGACVGIGSAQPSCVFRRTGPLTIFVTATDTNGATAYSAGRPFPIDVPPSATIPNPNRTTADVGQSVQFTTHATGGSGSYTYAWSGVPASCATTSVPVLNCAPPKVGIFSVSVQVVDSFGGSSTTTAAIGLAVYSDPVVPAPVPSPARVGTRELFTISVNVSGGLESSLNLTWEGVPGGCSFSQPIATTATCRTIYPGTYLVFVSVVDGNGFRVNSPKAQVVVTGSGPTNSTTGSNGTTILGLPTTEFYLGLGLVGVVVVVGAAVALSRRGRPARSEEAPLEPQEPEDGDGDAAPSEEEAPAPEPGPSDDEPSAPEPGLSDEGSPAEATPDDGIAPEDAAAEW